MKLTRRSLFAAPALALTAAAQPPKPRLPRKDCFFGLHFDLHPNPGDPALGRDVTDEMVERFLAEVKPDFVQYDCKGHVGYLGYPSKVGTSAPHIVNDSLAVWRRVTARHGVSLYIHFSGVWDTRAVTEHPEWARVTPEGKPDKDITSLYGPYVDKLMIPELKEAVGNYDLDGLWIDGDCWAVKMDYSEAALDAFRRATGLQQLPKKEGDAGWREFIALQREQFRKYVRRYVGALHEFRPNLQIASNWLYSTLAPERPDIPVDYISGDYAGTPAMVNGRIEARYMSQTGKPWDLMAWGFHHHGSRPAAYAHKPAVELEQEASVVIAQGGGFQIYYQPTRAGKLDPRLVRTMSEVAKFCRARQELSFRSETVPQAGVLMSTHTLYTTVNKILGDFGRELDGIRGMIDVLVDNQYSVDAVPEWRLAELAAKYPLLVVPEWKSIGDKVRDELLAYVRGGGRLLVTGVHPAALFAEALGVKLVGEPAEQAAFVTGDETFGNVRGLWQNVEPGSAAAIESRHPTFDSSRDAQCAATLSNYGKGQIAAIFGPLGASYKSSHTAATRQFVRRVVRRLFQPMVEVSGVSAVEVVVRRKKGRLLVHLINTAGLTASTDFQNGGYVPVVGPLRLKVKLPAAPSKVTVGPGSRPVAGAWEKGVWQGTLPKLAIHDIVSFS
jgi:hypothetical protein